MKKMILLMMMALSVLSCSDDSSSNSESASGLVKKVSMSLAGTNTYEFFYDNQKRINKIIRTGTINDTQTLHYDGDKLKSVSSDDDSQSDYTFSYNSAGKFISFSKDGVEEEVMYFETDQSYNYSENSFKINQYNDLTLIQNTQIAYDTTKKGAFFDNNAQLYLLGVFVDGYYTFFATKYPSTGVQFFNYEHIHDTNGILTSSVATGAINFTVTYEYYN